MIRSALVLLVALEVLVVLPLPITLRLFAGAEAGVSWPVLWLLAGGFLAICHAVATRSVPLALLLAWAGARTLIAGLPLRSTFLVAEVVAVLALYVLAVALPARADRWLLGGLAGAALLTAWVGFEQVLGVGWTVEGLNAATGVVMRPFGWSARAQESALRLAPEVQQRSGLIVRGDVLGQPHGFLGHPNHFGVFLALALPAALQSFARRAKQIGWVVGGGLLALILLSRSRTAWVALGFVGLLWLWPRLGSRVRLGAALIVGAAGVGVGYALLTGAVTLGFRLRAWRLGWEVAMRAPWTGWGLGMWRFWALDPRGPIAAWTGERDAGWWLDAFNEPLQLFFELGAVGAAFGLLCLAQLTKDAWHGWQAGGAAQAWAATALVALVALWTTSLFHYPPLLLPVLVAAARLRARA